MSVKQICVGDVDVSAPDEPVITAARRMQTRKVGTLVVVNSSGEPVGLVTDRDLMVRVLAASRDPWHTKIREVMTHTLRTIGEEAAIETALRIMREGKFRRLPVVNAEGKLTGLISLDDILQTLTEDLKEISGLLEAESPGSLAGEAVPG